MDLLITTNLGAGDTVGWLYSRLVDERITQLENLLIVQKQLLNTSATGEKTEIIENLRQKMLLAEQQYDFARKNYLRSETLFNDSVITASEFELAETAFLQPQLILILQKVNMVLHQQGLSLKKLT